MVGDGDVGAVPVDFHWLSPPGVSVALFLSIGLLWLVIGILTPFFLGHRDGGLVVTERTDGAYLGASPKDLLEADPALGKVRTVLLTWFAGCLIAQGVAFLTLTWFGLREGRTWAIVTLAAAGIGAVVLWAVSLAPYYRAGVRFGLGEVPFIWVPAFFIPLATILAWIGVR